MQWEIADSSIICSALTQYYSLIIYLGTLSFALFHFSADKFHLPGHSVFSALIDYQSALPSAVTGLKTCCQSFLSLFCELCKRDVASFGFEYSVSFTLFFLVHLGGSCVLLWWALWKFFPWKLIVIFERRQDVAMLKYEARAFSVTMDAPCGKTWKSPQL